MALLTQRSQTSAPSRERENVLMSDSGLQAAVVLQLLGHLNCMHVKPLCT